MIRSHILLTARALVLSSYNTTPSVPSKTPTRLHSSQSRTHCCLDTIAHWSMGKAKPASTLSLLEMDDMVSIAAGYMKVHDDDLIQKFPEWEFFKDDTKANLAHRVAGAWHREKRKNAAKSAVYKSTSSERVDSHSSSFHPPTKIRLHETSVTDTLVDHPSSSIHLPRSVSTSLPLQSASTDLLLILVHLPSRPHTQKPPRHYAHKPLME